ncbi:unnamed protein product [Arabidopsis halleri]
MFRSLSLRFRIWRMSDCIFMTSIKAFFDAPSSQPHLEVFNEALLGPLLVRL